MSPARSNISANTRSIENQRQLLESTCQGPRIRRRRITYKSLYRKNEEDSAAPRWKLDVCMGYICMLLLRIAVGGRKMCDKKAQAQALPQRNRFVRKTHKSSPLSWEYRRDETEQKERVSRVYQEHPGDDHLAVQQRLHETSELHRTTE